MSYATALMKTRHVVYGIASLGVVGNGCAPGNEFLYAAAIVGSQVPSTCSACKLDTECCFAIAAANAESGFPKP
jgi:hypothetical protein